MNQRKAKAMRRAAIAVAKRFPDIHSKVTYQDIVRQKVVTREVIDENSLQKGLRFLGRLLGKKSKPKTKEVETVVEETRTTRLASGWKFILRRFKAAVRRRDAMVNSNGHLVEVRS